MRADGRRQQQCHDRAKKAEFVAGLVLEALDMERVEQTGAIFPRQNLKNSYVRRLVSFASLGKCSGKRFFTQRLVKLVLKKIIKKLPFGLARDPQQTLDQYIAVQASRFQKLMRKAKRVASRQVLQASRPL